MSLALKNIFVSLFLISPAGPLAAQCIDYLFRDNNKHYASTLCGSASYALGSNAITNEFFGKFYKGGFIDAALKDRVNEKLINSNRLGADLKTGVDYLYLPDTLFGKPRLGIFAGISDRAHFDMRFSKDLFQTGFYGNKAFAGETAHLGDFQLQLLRYQQAQIGLLWAGLDTAKAKLGIGISFLKGEQLLDLDAPTADLYTSDDGTFIDLTTSATMLRSDSASKGLGAMNGMGGSIDLFLEAPYRLKKRKGVITIRITDMGTIFWNSRSLRYSADSTYHYTGFAVDNIFKLQDSTFNEVASAEDVIGKNVTQQRKGFSTTVPAMIDLSTNTSYGKLRVIKGFRQRFNSNHKGQFYLKAHYFFTPGFMAGALVSYGGYGNFSYGLELAADLGKGFILYAGSNNLEGFIVPVHTTAQGAFLSLKKHF